MLTRAQKEALVQELTEKLQRAQSVVFTDFRGLNVADTNQLRSQLRRAGVEYRVIKNTLVRRAAQAAGIDGVDTLLEGPTALAFGYDDPVTPVRELTRFAKDFSQLQIKGGILEGRLIGQGELQRLADLPSKDELLAKVLGGMKAPLSGLAGAFSATLRSWLYVLEALRQQREAQA